MYRCQCRFCCLGSKFGKGTDGVWFRQTLLSFPFDCNSQWTALGTLPLSLFLSPCLLCLPFCLRFGFAKSCFKTFWFLLISISQSFFFLLLFLLLCFFPRFLVASLSSSISIPVCACGFGVLSLAREWMAAENLTVIVFCQASSPPSISISVCIVFLSLFFSASFPVSSSPLSLFHRLSISICLRFSLLFFVFG